MAERRRSESQDAVFENGVARPARTAVWPFRTELGPLSLTPKRVRLVWFALAVIGLLPILSAPGNRWGDWSAFWSAGGTVGTASLMDPHLHMAWQAAHGIPEDAWRYPPSFAYLYWPSSLLPIGLSFTINAALMLSLVAVAARLLSRVFDLPWDLTVRLAFAWTPALAAVDMGQNAPLSVVLALWSIDALRRDSRTEAGLAAGLLMYKPTLGLPMLGLLLLRRCWRSASVASLVVAAGYVLSVPAAGGDWQWPVAWWNGMQPLVAHDLAFNADKAISVPGLLGRVPGLPYWLPFACGGVVALVALRGLVRAPMVEAASAACLVGLVVGPRVWSYEAGLMLPLLAWAVAGGLAEPWRTRLVFLAISMGILWWISPLTVVSGVAVTVDAALILWMWRWRPFGPGPLVVAGAPG
ncbi:MAG: glycosyltransferase family 87 protein [Candidatus Limnocylindrales bacterium]